MLADPHICCFLAKQYAWEKMRSIQSSRYSSSPYHSIYKWRRFSIAPCSCRIYAPGLEISVLKVGVITSYRSPQTGFLPRFTVLISAVNLEKQPVWDQHTNWEKITEASKRRTGRSENYQRTMPQCSLNERNSQWHVYSWTNKLNIN